LCPGLTFVRVRDIAASAVAVAMPDEGRIRQAVDFAELAKTLSVSARRHSQAGKERG
jgi:hypothetical protein